MSKDLTYRKFVKHAQNTPSDVNSAHRPLREAIKSADEEEQALDNRRRPSRLKRPLYTLVTLSRGVTGGGSSFPK